MITRLRGALIASVLICGTMNPARAESVILRSGNGSIGGNDSLVTMLVGPADSAFPAAFTAADFTNARTGPDAFIIAPNGAWISGLAGDPSTKWIATNANGAGEGSTALYAINFVLSQAVSSATLDLHYAVDNVLGGGPDGGVFLNGAHDHRATPPAGTSTPNSPSIATTSRRYCTSAPIRSTSMRRTRAARPDCCSEPRLRLRQPPFPSLAASPCSVLVPSAWSSCSGAAGGPALSELDPTAR